MRGIVFDLGNTLMYLDTAFDALHAQMAADLVDALCARGAKVSDAFGLDYIAARREGYKRALQTNIEYTALQALSDTLARHGVCFLPDEALPSLVEKFFAQEYAHWCAYADVIATLKELRAQGYKIAALSNASDHVFIEHITARGGIQEFFDPLLSSAKIAWRKPDPRAFQPILGAWQIPPREIVMVGDAPSFDILGAHRVGMRGVLVAGRWDTLPQAHGEFEDAALMQPDAIVHEIAELPALLETWEQEER